MKIIFTFLLLVSFSAFGQMEYEFDTVYVYEGEIQNIKKELKKETRYYYVNSELPDHFLVVYSIQEQQAFAVFRDAKNGRIAEFEIEDFQLSDGVPLIVSRKILKRNRYINPLPYRNFSRKEQVLEGSLMRYTYQVNRGRKFRDNLYQIDIDTSKSNIPLGVGFADYYSLFPLGENQPDGLVVNTYCSEGSEVILSSLSLKGTRSQKITLRFL